MLSICGAPSGIRTRVTHVRGGRTHRYTMGARLVNPLGLEPRIFGLKVRCICHYAKGPVCLQGYTTRTQYPREERSPRLDGLLCIHGETLISLLPAGNHLFSHLAQVPVRGCSYTQGATACSSNNKKPWISPGSLQSVYVLPHHIMQDPSRIGSNDQPWRLSNFAA